MEGGGGNKIFRGGGGLKLSQSPGVPPINSSSHDSVFCRHHPVDRANDVCHRFRRAKCRPSRCTHVSRSYADENDRTRAVCGLGVGTRFLCFFFPELFLATSAEPITRALLRAGDSTKFPRNFHRGHFRRTRTPYTRCPDRNVIAVRLCQ